MEEFRIVRVIGLSSATLLDPADPFNPINRRVSIIVMNRKAEQAALTDGGTIEADGLGAGARLGAGAEPAAAATPAPGDRDAAGNGSR
jgi:chemotaxis protein MotB